jgi:hypothetical protein
MDQPVQHPARPHLANQRLLRQAEEKERIGQLECAFVEFPTQFGSFEIKRVYSRFFETAAHEIFVISIKSRGLGVDDTVVDTAEAALQQRLEDAKNWIASKTHEAETLCTQNGINPLPKFLAPLKVEVKVISPLQREYLELMVSADHLIGLIEILAIAGTIQMRRAAQEKNAVRAKVRKIPGYIRLMRQGMNKVIFERLRLGSLEVRKLAGSGKSASASQTLPVAHDDHEKGRDPDPGSQNASLQGAPPAVAPLNAGSGESTAAQRPPAKPSTKRPKEVVANAPAT